MTEPTIQKRFEYNKKRKTGCNATSETSKQHQKICDMHPTHSEGNNCCAGRGEAFKRHTPKMKEPSGLDLEASHNSFQATESCASIRPKREERKLHQKCHQAHVEQDGAQQHLVLKVLQVTERFIGVHQTGHFAQRLVKFSLVNLARILSEEHPPTECGVNWHLLFWGCIFGFLGKKTCQKLTHLGAFSQF